MDWSTDQLIYYLQNPLHIAYDIHKFYSVSMEDADPRVSHWFLMSSIMPTLYAIGTYLSLVTITSALSRYLPKFEFLCAMRVYNISLVLISAYTLYELVVSSVIMGQNVLCSEPIYSTDEANMRYAKAIWLYYFSKLIEFTDTTFFVLRGKFNQVTILHVYHHATMPFIWWIGVKWHAGGITHIGPVLNSIIHVIMYFYYFLASYGDRFRKFLWWKRYLTVLQLIQFHMVLFHTLYALTYEDCGYSRRVLVSQTVYLLSLICLFLNFYFKNYTKGRRPAGKKIIERINNGGLELTE